MKLTALSPLLLMLCSGCGTSQSMVGEWHLDIEKSVLKHGEVNPTFGLEINLQEGGKFHLMTAQGRWTQSGSKLTLKFDEPYLLFGVMASRDFKEASQLREFTFDVKDQNTLMFNPAILKEQNYFLVFSRKVN